MFSKTADPTSAPVSGGMPAPNRPMVTNTRSVLAQDLRITGEVTSTGSIEILGEIEGTLTARGLIIGAEGRVSGSVTADTVEVRGKLDGKVTSQSFTLRSSAEVAADVTYTALVIESGAQIEGKFTLDQP